MVLTFEYGGLIGHVEELYTFDTGKNRIDHPIKSRNNLLNKLNKVGTIIEEEVYVILSPILSPPLWQRYELTEQDIQKIYDHHQMSASYIWQQIILLPHSEYERSTKTGINATFQSIFSFLFTEKKQTFNKFKNYFSEYFYKKNVKNNNYRICTERKDITPFIPKITVDKKVFNHVLFSVPPSHPSYRFKVHYFSKFRYKDIDLVPTCYDEKSNLIKMNRIMKKSTYDNLPVKFGRILCYLPFIIVYHDANTGEEEEYVLLHETCFFGMNEPKNDVINDSNNELTNDEKDGKISRKRKTGGKREYKKRGRKKKIKT